MKDDLLDEFEQMFEPSLPKKEQQPADLDDVDLYLDGGAYEMQKEIALEQLEDMKRNMSPQQFEKEFMQVPNYEPMPQGMKEAQQRNGVRDHGLESDKLITGSFEYTDETKTVVYFKEHPKGVVAIQNPNYIDANIISIMERRFPNCSYMGRAPYVIWKPEEKEVDLFTTPIVNESEIEEEDSIPEVVVTDNSINLEVNIKSPEENVIEHPTVDLGEIPPATTFKIEPLLDDKGQVDLFSVSNEDDKFLPEPIIVDHLNLLEKVQPEEALTNIELNKPIIEKDGLLSRCVTETPLLDKALKQSEPSNTMINTELLEQVTISSEDKTPEELIAIIRSSPVQYFTGNEVTTERPVQIEGKDFITLTVLGNPNAQKRHKTFKMGAKNINIQGHDISVGGRNVNTDPSAGAKADFLAIVQKEAPSSPLLGPLKLSVHCFFPRPTSHYRSGKNSHILKDDHPEWHISRPDTDNCLKFVMDSLNGVFWKDDSQICSTEASKKYDDSSPRTVIIISRP